VTGSNLFSTTILRWSDLNSTELFICTYY
jgi:hypothetical protein